MALNVGELFVLFKLDSSGVTTGLNGISAKLTSMGTEFMQAGILWKNYLTRPILNFGKDSVQTAMNFEKEMAKTVAKTGIDKSTEEGIKAYQQLEDEAMRVAKDSIFTSEEVAGAYDKMAMAGWEWESMVGGLEPIMDLAAASAEDVVTVSDIVTDAMTAFGLTFENADHNIGTFQKDVQHFTDVLAAAATSSNTDVNKMGQSFKYVGSMAGTMGYKIDDVAVALGLMANRGTKASQAGTALRRVLQVLAAPTTDKQEAIISELGLSLTDENGKALDFMQVMQELRTVFQDMNIDVEGYTNKLTDLSDEYSDVIDAAAEFEKAGGKINEDGSFTFTDEGKKEQKKIATSDVQKRYKEYIALVQKLNDQLVDSQQNGAKLTQVQYATDLFGPRGMLALLAITQSSQEEFDNLVEAVYGSEGRTHEMKETMLDNAMGDLEKFRSSVDILKTQIGELINKSLSPLLQDAKEVVDRFIGLDDETKESIITMAGFAAVIGPALIGIGLLMKLLPGLASAFSFLASPMGIVTALLAAIAIAALDTDGQIGKALSGIGEMLGIDLSEFSIDDLDVQGMLDNMLGGIGDLASNPAVTGFMERLGQGLAGALGSLGDICGQIIGYILSPEGLSKIWDAGVSIAKLLLSGIGSILSGIGSFLENLVFGILKGLGLVDEDAHKHYQEEVKAVEEAKETVTETLEEAAKDPEMLNAAENMNLAVAQALFGGIEKLDFDTRETVLQKLWEAQYGNLDWYEWTSAQDSLFAMKSEMERQIFEAIHNLDEDEQLTGEAVRAIISPFIEAFGLSSDMLSDEAYEAIARGFTTFDGRSEMWKAIVDAFVKKAEEQTIEEAEGNNIEVPADTVIEAGEVETEEYVDELEKAKQEAIAQVTDEFGTTEVVLPETIVELADNYGSYNGTKGMEKELADGKSGVGKAVAEVSNEAVQQFLLTMSEGNGRLVGSSYIAGIISGLREAGIIATASAIANSVATVISSWLSPSNGYSVGLAYGSAIAEGLSVGLSAGMSLGVNAPSQVASVVGGGSVQGGTSAGDVVGAIKQGFRGVGVYLDSEKVGNGVSDVVSRNIAREADSRSAGSFIG